MLLRLRTTLCFGAVFFTALVLNHRGVSAIPAAAGSSAEPSRGTDAHSNGAAVSRATTFDPIGKSFMDFLWEAKRAYDARDYDRVIQLMDYALTLNIDSNQAATAIMNRGSAYALKDDPDRAIQDFDQALKFNPARAQAYRDRGAALMRKNNLDDALRDFEQSIALAPQRWEGYEARARLFMATHDWAAALKDIERAIKLDPKASSAYASRASIHVRYRQYKEALADAEKALSIDHDDVGAHITRANSYIRLKQYDQAEGDLKTALTLNPKGPGAKFNALAWIRATCLDPKIRNGGQAVEFGKRACELSRWKNWSYIDTLAASYAEAGDFDSAAKYEEQAIQMVEDSPPPNISEVRARLALYQKHQVYRDELKP